MKTKPWSGLLKSKRADRIRDRATRERMLGKLEAYARVLALASQ